MSVLYTDYVEGLWDSTANTLGRVDILSDTIKGLLIDTALYAFDQDADIALDDIPSGAIAATVTATGLAVASRGFTLNPLVFTSVPAGPALAAVVLYMHTGTASTSPLIAYLDDDASGLPVTPDGTNITVNPGAGGIAVF